MRRIGLILAGLMLGFFGSLCSAQSAPDSSSATAYIPPAPPPFPNFGAGPQVRRHGAATPTARHVTVDSAPRAAHRAKATSAKRSEKHATASKKKHRSIEKSHKVRGKHERPEKAHKARGKHQRVEKGRNASKKDLRTKKSQKVTKKHARPEKDHKALTKRERTEKAHKAARKHERTAKDRKVRDKRDDKTKRSKSASDLKRKGKVVAKPSKHQHAGKRDATHKKKAAKTDRTTKAKDKKSAKLTHKAKVQAKSIKRERSNRVAAKSKTSRRITVDPLAPLPDGQGKKLARKAAKPATKTVEKAKATKRKAAR